ncbi:hypothetical protein [Streptomyces sp. I05A-00742]|uniref:hypothetical protein n=1 Tax=Streptomyces sp. I05A-00742 TaxID=2732853 RepID=UPI001487CA41|nr:hypothetical protein [Streptomyces sp. I05A-00742]
MLPTWVGFRPIGAGPENRFVRGPRRLDGRGPLLVPSAFVRPRAGLVTAHRAGRRVLYARPRAGETVVDAVRAGRERGGRGGTGQFGRIVRHPPGRSGGPCPTDRAVRGAVMHVRGPGAVFVPGRAGPARHRRRR